MLPTYRHQGEKVRTFYLPSSFSIVTITSKTVAGEWWGQQVLDIADLHEKELEFEVLIYHLKLRELSKSVSISALVCTQELSWTLTICCSVDGLLLRGHD